MRLPKRLMSYLPGLLLATSAVAADYPVRGMNMQDVRAWYGEPQTVTQSAGPVRKNWPRITAWHYGSFSVYFERATVLHTVVH